MSILQTLSLQELQEDFDGALSTDSNNNSTVNGTNSAISYIASNTLTVNSQITTPIPNGMSAKTEDPILTAPPIVNFHTIIIDMSAVCFVDLMGIKALGKVIQLLFFLLLSDAISNFIRKHTYRFAHINILKTYKLLYTLLNNVQFLEKLKPH